MVLSSTNLSSSSPSSSSPSCPAPSTALSRSHSSSYSGQPSSKHARYSLKGVFHIFLKGIFQKSTKINTFLYKGILKFVGVLRNHRHGYLGRAACRANAISPLVSLKHGLACPCPVPGTPVG